MSEPVLLIPGVMCDARLFAHQIEQLSLNRPVMVTLPTHGVSVEEISAVIFKQAPASFAVVGIGLGGQIALDLVRRGVNRVSRIVLLSTDPLAENPQVAAARDARIVAARAGRLAQAMIEEYPDTSLTQSDALPDLRAKVQLMAETLGEGVFIRQSRAMQRRPDQQKTLRRALLPALILAGARDQTVPMRRHEFIAGLMPFAKLQVIEGAGTLAPLEQPEAVTAALESFLQGPMLLR